MAIDGSKVGTGIANGDTSSVLTPALGDLRLALLARGSAPFSHLRPSPIPGGRHASRPPRGLAGAVRARHLGAGLSAFFLTSSGDLGESDCSMCSTQFSGACPGHLTPMQCLASARMRYFPLRTAMASAAASL